MKYKAIVFDCDGTLLDTISDLTNAVNFALQSVNAPMQTDVDTLGMVGNGIKKLVERSLPDNKKELFDVAFKKFKEYYNDHYDDFTKPYQGIPETLQILKEKGYVLLLVSNKNTLFLEKLYNKFFYDTISVSLGETEGLKPKPAPDMVEYVVKKVGIDKKDAVYVGDSDVDIQTAKNSGLDCISVSWGFKTREDLIKYGANIIIDAPQELLEMV